MKKLGILFVTIILSSLSFSEGIENVLVLENPDKPVTTFETKREKERGELNLNIKKISTSQIDGYVNESKKKITFCLDEVDLQDRFFLTDDKSLLNEYESKIKDYKNDFEELKRDILKKVVTFKYPTFKKNLYLVRYDSQSKKIKKIYRWENKGDTIAEDIRENINIYFSEDCKPFEIVNFSNDGSIKNKKGYIEEKSSNFLKANLKTVESYTIKDTRGKVLEEILVKNGVGKYRLDSSKKGVIIENGSTFLNLGIGFENQSMLLQIKGTSDWGKSYSLEVVENYIDGTSSNYSLSILPPQYGIKILDDTLSLEFLKSDEDGGKEIVAQGEIAVDSRGMNIGATFKNDGNVKLQNGENIIDVKLDTEMKKSLKYSNIKKVGVIGRVKKLDVKDLPDGDYLGKAELIITIDS